jgi:hypothetical protein
MGHSTTTQRAARFVSASALGIALFTTAAAFSPIPEVSAASPSDTDPYYAVLKASWEGGSIADDGWRLDTSAFNSTTNPPLPSGQRRAEYNAPSGRNLQIVDASGKLLFDVDSNGALVRLAGITYDGDAAANKFIAITTRRHCTADYTMPLVANGIAGSNETTGVCKGGVTRYSTGRISSATTKPVYGGFNVVTRVNLPSTSVAGTRFTVWMNNARPDWNATENGIIPAYCNATIRKTNLSEFDLFEWYGATKNLTQTGHASCDYDVVKGDRYATKVTISSATGWESASAEFDGSRNRYFLANNYQSPTLAIGPQGNIFGYSNSLWNSAPTAAQWHDAMYSPSTTDLPTETMKWQVIAQGEVFGNGYTATSGNFQAVKDTLPFPTETMLVDNVRWYAHA